MEIGRPGGHHRAAAECRIVVDNRVGIGVDDKAQRLARRGRPNGRTRIAACRKANVICLSVYRFRFMAFPPSAGSRMPEKIVICLEQFSGARPGGEAHTERGGTGKLVSPSRRRAWSASMWRKRLAPCRQLPRPTIAPGRRSLTRAAGRAYSARPLRCEKAVSALVMNSSSAGRPSSVCRRARRIALAMSPGSQTRSLQPPRSFARLA